MNVVIDASGLVLGRMSSYAAKHALRGNTVVIVNAEKAVVVGKPDIILAKNLKKLDIKNMASLNVGPYHHKRPDKFVRRSVRGMLPYVNPRGREAYKRVMAYMGAPADEIKRLQGVDIGKEKKADLKNLRNTGDSYLTVGEISRFIGGKWQVK